ncbi:TatD DNase family protein [Mesomycoplasma conjunctivae]|uniref:HYPOTHETICAL Uncharacterized deoxyribonuclease yabD n=1 Tax=Mesomycoplasma conjunctivae (strain ATCC 25834 / NCTC 10147 / HRC/581) TaxID=572263 RepID=C5J5I4_MESCH|nr:TatD family hydrolase [Mesomycoplasma conjunctivae]CAT04707.1 HYPOTHETICAL Uncharacterized deoxyribonuclease yabD [Mesomycoplasma conjunctivae]VEU65690.1 TatD DNase family protein [Mesomycoplasma conjunctivae]
MNWQFETPRAKYYEKIKTTFANKPKLMEIFQIKKSQIIINHNLNNLANFFDFLLVDTDNDFEEIGSYFWIAQENNLLNIELVFLHDKLDKKWNWIILEFIRDFILDNFDEIKNYQIWFNLPNLNNDILEELGFQLIANQKWSLKPHKPYKFIDVHTHPFAEYYNNSELEIEKNLTKNISQMILVGTSWDDVVEIDKLVKKYKNVYKIIGIHPNVVKENEDYSALEKYVDEKTLGIGEIGLDYFYENNPSEYIQLRSLLEQIKIAEKYNLAIMLHIRDNSQPKAIRQIQDIIDQYPKINFIFHNFSTTFEIYQQIVKKPNCFFSFSGVITFKKSYELRKIIQDIPFTKILTETDAPYLSPEPNRSLWPNSSSEVQWVYKNIARIKNITITKLIKIIEENFATIFKIDNKIKEIK